MKEWLKCAGIRTVKTFAEAMLSLIAVGSAINEINWTYVLSVSAVASLLALLSCIAGMPELKKPNIVGDIAVNPNTGTAMIEFTPENGANLKLGSQVAFNVAAVNAFESETIDDVEEGDVES